MQDNLKAGLSAQLNSTGNSYISISTREVSVIFQPSARSFITDFYLYPAHIYYFYDLSFNQAKKRK